MTRVAASRRDPQFNYLLALAQGRPVFTADYYAVDGVSGKVASFIDWNDFSHLLVQATSGNQVAIPAVHADFAGKLCADFTGAQRYVSNRPTASWLYLSDGSSMSVLTVCTPTATNTRLCSTRNSANGFLLGIQAGPSWLAFISGGPGPGFGRALNLPSMWAFRFTDGGGTPEYTAKVTGFTALVGDSTTPTAGPPAGPLVLGSNPDASLPFVGRVAYLSFGFDTGTVTAQAQSALTSLYGVAA